jgi:hypothetical protein
MFPFGRLSGAKSDVSPEPVGSNREIGLGVAGRAPCVLDCAPSGAPAATNAATNAATCDVEIFM